MCKIHAAWSRSCTSWRSPYHWSRRFYPSHSPKSDGRSFCRTCKPFGYLQIFYGIWTVVFFVESGRFCRIWDVPSVWTLVILISCSGGPQNNTYGCFPLMGYQYIGFEFCKENVLVSISLVYLFELLFQIGRLEWQSRWGKYLLAKMALSLKSLTRWMEELRYSQIRVSCSTYLRSN